VADTNDRRWGGSSHLADDTRHQVTQKKWQAERDWRLACNQGQGRL